ncbi:MAG: LuxR C-terminal-related transcriptional regulator [Actinobacteria bacterium]|nr:LuxR C-terminal-related transcriptional regulator [Actinomycetota bacterium]
MSGIAPKDLEPREASVVIVENHDVVGRALGLVLSSWGYHASAVRCGQLDLATLVEVIDQGPWWNGHCRIALVDLNLRRDLDGVALIGPLRERGIHVGVVSGVGDRLRLAQALAAGALAVVNKAQSLDELQKALELLSTGRPAISANEKAGLLGDLSEDLRRLKPVLTQLSRLTRAEAKVLGALCQGYNVHEIARMEVVSVATVRSHVHSVLVKLGVHSQHDAVRLARDARWPPSQASLRAR